MNNTEIDDLMESESLRHGMISAVVKNINDNTKIVSVFTDEEIKNGGFQKVDSPTFSVGDKHYCCATKKVLDFTKAVECDITSNEVKTQILKNIKKLGFTHIFKVDAHLCPFYFDLTGETGAEKSVSVMVRGATVRET